MIFGLKEDDRDAATRKQKDEADVKHIFEALNDGEVIPNQVLFRAGEKDGVKNRPLIVKVPQADKNNLVWKEIFISPDRTMLQRQSF